MLNYREYKNRTEWLNGRTATIGASDTASILGIGFRTSAEVWRDKTRPTGKEKKPDARIEYGQKAEEHLRALYSLQNVAEQEILYHEFRVYVNDKYPWLSCTLDGEIVEKSTGRLGVLEIKTATIFRKEEAAEWAGRIPLKYRAQLATQLAVTEYDFAVLFAQIMHRDGLSELVPYRYERAELQDDIDYILAETQEFYEKYIATGKEPPLKITL